MVWKHLHELPNRCEHQTRGHESMRGVNRVDRSKMAGELNGLVHVLRRSTWRVVWIVNFLHVWWMSLRPRRTPLCRVTRKRTHDWSLIGMPARWVYRKGMKGARIPASLCISETDKFFFRTVRSKARCQSHSDLFPPSAKCKETHNTDVWYKKRDQYPDVGQLSTILVYHLFHRV
jgi:hypothetical protein